MAKGWIRLHRQLQDSWLWSGEPFTKGQAWVDLLLSVNHADKKVFVNGEVRTIKRGQMLTSVVKLSERWEWSRGKTKRFLDALKMDRMITLECSSGGTTNGTTLTIVKYGDFQGGGTTDDTADDTTDDTTLDTTNGQRMIQRSDINNNDKEYIKNDKKENSTTTTFTPYTNSGMSKGYKKTEFHNYQQNDYDFDALEKYLLERSRKKL